MTIAMKKILFLLAVLLFYEVSAETIQKIIEAQNVTRNEEIKWEQLKYLDSKYRIVLVIFPQRPIQESDILVENGGNPKNLSTSLTNDSNNLLKLTIHGDIMMNSDKRLKIFYMGNNTLSIKKIPQSYIMLTNVKEQTTMKTVTKKMPVTTMATITSKMAMTTMAGGSTETNIQTVVIIVCLSILFYGLFYILYMYHSAYRLRLRN